MADHKKPADKEQKEEIVPKPICGIVMPISSFDGYSEQHWKDVYDIISEAAVNANFDPNLVSSSNEIGIIQSRIIQNLYNNEMAVVDVSGKNPNVMFELGIRLTFDKPTIIIKDERTNYSFDTSPIEHLSYPSDLHYQSILKFKETLKSKIAATYKRFTEDKSYTTFLKHFGEFKVAKLEQKEVSESEFILNAIAELRKEVRSISSINQIQNIPRPKSYFSVASKVTPIQISFLKEVFLQFVKENNIKDESEFHPDRKDSKFDFFFDWLLTSKYESETIKLFEGLADIKNTLKEFLLPF